MSPTLPETRFLVGHAVGQQRPARPGRVGQQELPARHGDDGVDRDLGNGTLIGHREHPHLGDPSPQNSTRTGCSAVGGKEVENAAADGEFAAFAHHVDAGVGQLDRRAIRSSKSNSRCPPPHGSVTGSIWAISAAIGCNSDARGHHHPQRQAQPGVVGGGPAGAAASAARPRCPLTRGQPLVRQRLPRTGTAPQHRRTPAQFGGESIGLATGGGHHQQRAAAGQRAGREQLCTGRADEGAVRRGARRRLLRGEHRRGERQIDQPGYRGLGMAGAPARSWWFHP